jgi:formylglycine-generating enzyme required for sulfatase activity/uncharacterized caspase-like protein
MSERNCAIVVGINSYEFIPGERQLKYAVNDALKMQEFLCKEAQFPEEYVLLCCDTSEKRPTRTQLRDLLRNRLKQLRADNLWFFFAGHGIVHEGTDYLLPNDSNLDDLTDTAIPINLVANWLKNSGAKNVVLVLDMCRDRMAELGSRSAGEVFGEQTIALAKEKGMVILYSCQQGCLSYEISELGHGAFTYTLLEGLKQSTTPRILEAYLCREVPALNSRHQKPVQVPRIILEPGWKYDLPLLSSHATVADIRSLIERAKDTELDAKSEADYELAESLWWQVIEAPKATFEDRSIGKRAIKRITKKLDQQNPTSPLSIQQPTVSLPLSEPVPLNGLRERWEEWIRSLDPPTQGLMRSAFLLQESPQEIVLGLPSQAFVNKASAARRLKNVQDNLHRLLERPVLVKFAVGKGESLTAASNSPIQNSPPTIEFEVVTISRIEKQGDGENPKIITTSNKREAEYQTVTLDGLGNALPLQMILIPGGVFTMGSPDGEAQRRDSESPQREVTVSQFFMSRYPITQAQWKAVAGMGRVDRNLEDYPSYFKGDNRPVERVSWYDAVEFCARLRQHTEGSYRLPSEAEWEYACRAGMKAPFHFGKTITPKLANYDGNYVYSNGSKGEYRQGTTSVDHFKIANAFGLSDMHGNVWEWCADHWHGSYVGVPTDGEVWLTGNKDAKCILRGGSWLNGPWYCRSAFRYSDSPESCHNDTGLRVVCPLLGI